MKLPFLTTLAAAAALALASCSNAEEAKAPLLPTGTAPSAINMEAAPQPASVEALATEAAPANATAQLNPPHGEPGHRCEIPVGAPLDGSTPPQAPITLEAPTTSPAAAPASPASGGSGKINPPHGEPGHDCAVPVGSPLP